MFEDQIELRWEETNGLLSLRIEAPDHGEDVYSAAAERVSSLRALPRAISLQTDVGTVAASYRQFLRSLTGGAGSSSDADVRFTEYVGSGLAGSIHLRFTAGGSRLAESVLGLPWEALIYDGNDERLEAKLTRVAMVRSLGRTDRFAPRRLEERFRVLLLQGGDEGPPLDYEGERQALLDAWSALGPTLHGRVEQPCVQEALRGEIADAVARVRPHLLWFSGHGDLRGEELEILLGPRPGGTWIPVRELAAELSRAREKTGHAPLVAAFWACEGGRAGGESGSPRLDATGPGFPALVRTMAATGVEAVLGVQTQIYDDSARVMGEALFRALAEGQGPALALAASRAALHQTFRHDEDGSGSEWVSPVLWVGGAQMPRLEWARPEREHEAILLNKVGRESLLRFYEGAVDVLAEPPGPAPTPAGAWVERAPCWVTCPSLEQAEMRLALVQALRRLALGREATVVLVPHESRRHFGSSVVEVVADAMRDLKRRLFPNALPESAEWLSHLFDAFDREHADHGWRLLLEREDLVLVIVAAGGIENLESLGDAAAAAGSVVVVSSVEAEGGRAEELAGWGGDTFDGSDPPPDPDDEAARAFLEAFALLNKPLAERDVDRFGRDYGLDGAHRIAGDALARVGGRRVVKARMARRLVEALTGDRERAAHRACLHFLERSPSGTFHAGEGDRLVWAMDHATAAGETDRALRLANDAVRELARRGRHAEVAALFKRLGAFRRRLRPEAVVDVAKALVETGHPRRAYNQLRQVDRGSLEPVQRLRLAVSEAEALRNTRDPDKQMKAVAVLEEALRETGRLTVRPRDRELWKWQLIARHDHARNIHYFLRRTPEAVQTFREVVGACGDDPELAYLKAAALRNLSDAFGRYTFGQVEPDHEYAEACLRQACELAKDSETARPLLAEMQYQWAKMLRRDRPELAFSQLRRAIEAAREGGVGFVLALARNKEFWWQMESDGFVLRDWQRLESKLELSSSHAWVTRALLDSRLRAARRLALRDSPADAVALLEKSRRLLRRDARSFAGPGDLEKRRAPVYAGLAVLSASQSVGYDRDVWEEFVQWARDSAVDESWLLKIKDEPASAWEGVE